MLLEIVKVKDIIRLGSPNENKTVWSLVQVPKVQGQLIALNPNDGSIEAVVGELLLPISLNR